MLFPFSTMGQVNTNSRWDVWQNEAKEDTTRLQALNDYIWKNYLFSQPDSAFYFAELAYNFAEEKGLKEQRFAKGIRCHDLGTVTGPSPQGSTAGE